MSNYEDFTTRMSATAGPQPRNPEAEAFAAMTPEEQSEHINRLQYEAARQRHLNKEAEIARKVAEGMANSPTGDRYNGGFGSMKATLRDGELTVSESGHSTKSTDQGGTLNVAPRDLWAKMNVWVGGMELGADQAREMVEDGQISYADYEAGLDRALKPYGYRAPSFKAA